MQKCFTWSQPIATASTRHISSNTPNSVTVSASQASRWGHLLVEKVFQPSVEVPRLGEVERDVYWDQLINARQPATPKATEAITERIIAELESANTEAAIADVIDRYRGDPDRADIAAAQAFKRLHAARLVKAREHFLLRYRSLIEPNPRAMKRLLNAYGFLRGFDLQSGRRSDPDALVRWTILENRWPILADYLEGRSSGVKQSEIVEALKKDTEVLRVAEGLIPILRKADSLGIPKSPAT
jgi:hypothetical protein